MHFCGESSSLIGNIDKLSCLGDARFNKSDDSTNATITHDGHESDAFGTCSQQQCTSYNWELCKWDSKYSGLEHTADISTWGSIQSNTNRTIWASSRAKCIPEVGHLDQRYPAERREKHEALEISQNEEEEDLLEASSDTVIFIGILKRILKRERKR
ncbi:hypothetical protein CKAN_00218700 [Cinnamomum micranthum f. kanehirae]|uniref:Uncharacterized protein n=1 Tax=Cinnamomum micranthum f. kanehirae TaxID=337451 RepID=A0A3S3M631_9MAGN|nr:hypothetical protein CKAN_00218700 [Cinnamomum micranthum f. kanehirae]